MEKVLIEIIQRDAHNCVYLNKAIIKATASKIFEYLKTTNYYKPNGHRQPEINFTR